MLNLTSHSCCFCYNGLMLNGGDSAYVQQPLLTGDIVAMSVDAHAARPALQIAIREEAEELLSEKRVISGAINIRTNKDKMKVRCAPLSCVASVHMVNGDMVASDTFPCYSFVPCSICVSVQKLRLCVLADRSLLSRAC